MEEAIATIRQFNRFYTRYVGALNAHFLGSDLSLAEARILFEIVQGLRLLASDLQSRLGMDAGFVSRVISRFEARGWIVRTRDSSDARQLSIAITSAGQAMFQQIDERQHEAVVAILERLQPSDRADLCAALRLSQTLLDDEARPAFTLRTFRPGDMGMIAARQSILYRDVYGWGPQIEVIAGEVTTEFVRNFKPGREQCWVAEVNGTMAGSVFLTDEGDGLCRLRLLYVESFARGLGIGNALVEACLTFAREIGYSAMTLWTHTILTSARRIYAAHGFEIVESHVHEEFGAPIESETWRLDLRRP
ncbi:MAG TPA: bifunctional helix-turn-helix transcriptional regulator/GNAT family N-acetyltransferase [Sphingomonas sp.]|uniref:bifunctional helix-turn-helix transcriptional regulator/GNAT family N-acetyltransferase n=1 Tax=Sphingomonas sp. TaxID=28214 RepID=UPI002CFB4586|nr:bifunctional helix-turn-helix transcriptional regulator/GNAT family N-acetyltransferase [Sphingomonas sp.]HMI18204.1 bifunctional helix-turn-helix transcriptional regulator/GNAT family N-acetyltransferase [Sphingomonas sp.]